MRTMAEIHIRFMEERDLEAVAAIEREAISPPWSKNAFRDSLSLSHTIFLVAECGGELAGYCGAYQSLEEAEITNVAVKKELRGQGIAKRLLLELFDIGKSRGAFAFTLEVRVTNQAAIHLYEKLGFESLGVRKNFYEKPREDALIMWRRWEL